MIASKNFFDKLIEYEGMKTKAYLDSADIPTIGIGTIVYPDGEKVRMGDTCTYDEALEYCRFELKRFEVDLNKLIKGVVLTQNQYDAMLLLMYNIGSAGFSSSTVLKRIKANPQDSTIKEAWLRWNKAKVDGVLKPVQGLTNRRLKEYILYIS